MTRTRILFLVATAVALVGLTACGSSSGNGSSSNTTAGSSTKTTASGSSVDDFASNLQKGKDVAFDATYESRPSSGGDTSTFRVAQKKPKSLFETSSGDSTTTVINDGTTTYLCSKSGSDPATCIKQPGTSGLNSVAAPMLGLVDPGAISTSLRALDRVPGVNVDRSSKTIAGEHATCVTVKVSGQGSSNDGTWCVIKAGVLAYVESGGNVVELTKFTTDVGDSTFELPGEVQG